jgi:hypothetical protein
MKDLDYQTPKVGEGATQFGYSDTHAYFVTYVSKNGKECKIQRAKYKCLDYYAGQYEVKPDTEGEELTLRFRYGKWKVFYTDRLTGETGYAPFNVAFGYAREYEDPHF